MPGSREVEYAWKSAWRMKELTSQRKVDALECLKLMKHAKVASVTVGAHRYSWLIKQVVECGCCLPDSCSQNEGNPARTMVYALCGGCGLTRSQTLIG